MRRHGTHAARVALIMVVLASGTGVLAMHTLVAVGADAASSADHTMPDVLESSVSRAARALHDASDVDGGHVMGLLDCIALLITGLALVFAACALGRRTVRGTGRPSTSRIARVEQRAPPLAVRLSLVGVARR